MLKKLFNPFRNKTRQAYNSEQPTVLEAHEHQLSSANFSRNSANVAVRLQQAGFQAYLVGGCVRDSLINITPKDFDVATNATPEQVRQEFRNSRIIGRRFRLAHVHFGREIIEVATFRSDHAQADSSNSDRSAHDASGRILRDNVYGSMVDDAKRRDFTMNALYFDVSSEQIYDYSTGFADIQRRLIRLIGEPEQRYSEDPVRMLRAIRFAAKLDFNIEDSTAEPIRRLAPLLRDIPPARLYDETLKLFLSGHAVRTYELLCEYDLFAELFPSTAQAMQEQPEYVDRLLRNAFENTDYRINISGRPVTPAYLFAAILWPALSERVAHLRSNGMHPVPALQEAGNQVFFEQVQRVAIPKRFSIPTREIWAMQERLPRRAGKRADKLLSHPRFRAAYNFLVLRESAGEKTQGLGQWWTDYQNANDSHRRAMINNLSGKGGKPRSRRRRPRTRKPNHSKPDQQ